MALSQALSTGITGLMTHQKAMDNIGNNLANVNTVGFKKGVYQFSTLLEQSLRGGMMADSSTGRGSVNPISLGLGAQTGSINKVFTQGPIENTGNPNDMAIDGNGFFVLRQDTGYVYTRAGSFYRGEDGTLMAADGLYVQGTMAVKNADGSITIPQDAKLQNIVIPIGSTGGHAQTSKVSFTGNLDSRQDISSGTSLFGGSSYPTVSSLQQWMSKDFNGGDPIKDSKVDTTWNALEDTTYAISESTLRNYGLSNISLPSNITRHDDGVVMTYPTPNDSGVLTNPKNYSATVVYDVANNRTVSVSQLMNEYNVIHPGGISPVTSYVELDSATGSVWDQLTTEFGALVPLVEEIKTINGGNVQTSAAYGVEVPTYADSTTLLLPEWFYSATGATMGYSGIANIYDQVNLGSMTEEDAFKAIWANGFNGEGEQQDYLPREGEVYPASLNTPLERLRYLKGNVWVQPYANIKNGDEITISFKKGDSQVETTFVYNRPEGTPPFNGQQAINQEQSYTLRHFLAFLGGDVDEPSVACQGITPAMFGAPVDLPDHPDGNPNGLVEIDPPGTFIPWKQTAGAAQYEQALENISLAKLDSNLDSTGGAMGLLSIPPQISDRNYGDDAYDTPVESAGAYSRTGVSQVGYKRWNPATQSFYATDPKHDSFNTSFVSNLGSQNALSDIRITYNNVPHETMYNAEKDYNAPQGGSSIVTVDFCDSLGNPKSATLRMAMVSQNDDFTTWRWIADCADDSDFQWQADPNTGELTTNLNVGTGLIRFDKNGNFVKGAEYSESNGITINQANQGVNEPIWIKVLNGLSGSSKQDLDFSELTCSATSNSFKLASQNGRPPGTLNDFTVSLDGTIQGIYSNGNVVPIARLCLAIIPNENGLIAAGSNLFYTGPASGDALYGHANTGGNGKIRHMQLESSNVDLSEEFTKLITTERGFQANSRTITTADEMITELLNLKR